MTAVIHRNTRIQTSPPGEQYSCGDNAPRFSGNRGYGFTGLGRLARRQPSKLANGARFSEVAPHGFTGLRAGLRFGRSTDGRARWKTTQVQLRHLRTTQHRPLGRNLSSGNQAPSTEHFFTPRPSKNFNAQGVDGFHASPQKRIRLGCRRAHADKFNFSETFASHVKTYACGDSSCGTKQSKFETMSAVK